MKNHKLAALCLLTLAAAPGPLLADDCKFSKDIDMRLDVAASQSLDIIARAGQLHVTGRSGTAEVLIGGRACASEEEWLEEARVETRSGEKATVEVKLPEVDSGWSFWGNRYVRLDLELQVPENLLLDIKDSSGSMHLAGIGSANIKDSSGSIEVNQAAGPLQVQDSSGSIRFDRIRGDVIIESDSSGSISGRHIDGSVLVKRDSSGSIEFRDVGGDFTVERDSSGSISANGIGGDFTVLKDGSGGIQAENVTGSVSVPGD
jgi:DUF4097 and DUF4098 domain-containing protein YvlB